MLKRQTSLSSQVKYNRKKGIRAERATAKKLGYTTKKGSGCSAENPGDFQNDTHLVEHKYTDKGSFLINSKLLTKICYEALLMNREPLFMIRYFERYILKLEPQKERPDGEIIDIRRRGKSICSDHTDCYLHIKHLQYTYWRIRKIST